MWRLAQIEDSARIIGMCRDLYFEDPGEDARRGEKHIEQTLAELRANPVRGKAAVLELDREIVGYALLISYWSNEFNGEFCTIDELFVEPGFRGKGFASELVRMLQKPQNHLWPRRPAAIMVEAYRTNPRAKKLYERLGFEPNPNHHMVYLVPET